MALTDATRELVQVTIRKVRQNLGNDVMALEGEPFTGRVVSEHLGKLAADVDALAGMLERVVREI